MLLCWRVSAHAIHRAGFDRQRHAGRGHDDCGQLRDGGVLARNGEPHARHSFGPRVRRPRPEWFSRSRLAHGCHQSCLRKMDCRHDADGAHSGHSQLPFTWQLDDAANHVHWHRRKNARVGQRFRQVFAASRKPQANDVSICTMADTTCAIIRLARKRRCDRAWKKRAGNGGASWRGGRRNGRRR